VTADRGGEEEHRNTPPLASIEAQFSSPRILQKFSHSPSHQIFGRMHEVLNINKKQN
jgi:hypothetical protein